MSFNPNDHLGDDATVEPDDGTDGLTGLVDDLEDDLPADPETTAPTPAAATPAQPAPVPAPAPATQLAPEAATEPAAATDTTEPAPTPETAPPASKASQALARAMDPYKRRRRLTGIAAAALLGFGVLTDPFGWRDASDPTAELLEQAATPASEQETANSIAGDQDKAQMELERAGTLDGFTAPGPGIRTAAAGQTALMSRQSAGACYFYGVIDGQKTEVQVDKTGAACTDAEIARAQAALDAAATQALDADAQSATSQLLAAADVAAYHASRNFAETTQSLEGLPANIDGVEVLDNDGTSARLRAHAGRACKEAIVAADGQLGEIHSC